jgi:hypothetical protein
MQEHASATEASKDLPCAQKLAFDTQKQASAAANVAEYQRGVVLKVYRCRHCQLWHMSSNTSN